MRKATIITCLSLSALIILDSLNAGHAFMMFLLAGVIPGTDFAISATVMMQLFALIAGFISARFVSWLLTLSHQTQPTHA